MNGILLVDKPAGLTSHDVVDRVRRAARTRRVGHTGTLDPAATGLLVVCVGAATRLSEFLTRLDKTYEGTMRLGMVTDSHDLDGAVVAEHPVPDITAEQAQEALNRYAGEIEQKPPMVSAVKVNGERLYKRARKGEDVERPARRVTVYEFRVTACAPPDIAFVLRCTSGTYARSLCHDAGDDLGCGAALAGLRRTAVGKHSVEAATPLDALQEPGDVERRLVSPGDALDLPRVTITEAARSLVMNGGAVERALCDAKLPEPDAWVQVLDTEGQLLAVGQVVPGQRVQPRRVLAQ
jgi:tRNA pseudouridine55 synthase